MLTCGDLFAQKSSSSRTGRLGNLVWHAVESKFTRDNFWRTKHGGVCSQFEGLRTDLVDGASSSCDGALRGAHAQLHNAHHHLLLIAGANTRQLHGMQVRSIIVQLVRQQM